MLGWLRPSQLACFPLKRKCYSTLNLINQPNHKNTIHETEAEFLFIRSLRQIHAWIHIQPRFGRLKNNLLSPLCSSLFSKTFTTKSYLQIKLYRSVGRRPKQIVKLLHNKMKNLDCSVFRIRWFCKTGRNQSSTSTLRESNLWLPLVYVLSWWKLLESRRWSRGFRSAVKICCAGHGTGSDPALGSAITISILTTKQHWRYW